MSNNDTKRGLKDRAAEAKGSNYEDQDIEVLPSSHNIGETSSHDLGDIPEEPALCYIHRASTTYGVQEAESQIGCPVSPSCLKDHRKNIRD